eukprot:251982_1
MAVDPNTEYPMEIYSDYIGTIGMLLFCEANANVINNYGVTILMIASRERKKDIFESLLKYNAKVSMESKEKVTSLHCAAAMGYTNILNILLKYGANYTIKSTQ